MVRAPPKKNLFEKLLCKIRAFFGENRVEFGNFVNCRANNLKIREILLIFHKYFFSGKSVSAPDRGKVGTLRTQDNSDETQLHR